MTNIEIKARVADPLRVHGLATQLCGPARESLFQEDTFFNVNHGWLKLRVEHGAGTLIAYSRAKVAGPRPSRYFLAGVDNPGETLGVLAAALSVRGVVRKERKVYLHGQTRIHVDEVEGLGSFVEIEVVLAEFQSEAEGRTIAHRVMEALEIPKNELVSETYLELIERQRR